MARKKSTEAIGTEINKVKSDMSRLQDRYDKLADKLKELQDQKRRIELIPSWMPTLRAAKVLTRS